MPLSTKAIDRLRVRRNAPYLYFLALHGNLPRHYVRFPGRHADVAVTFPCSNLGRIAEILGFLSAFRASDHLKVLGVLKLAQAQRILQRVVGDLERVGLSETEWTHRMGTSYLRP